MILKHAIRYLELTGSDFITDLKDFAKKMEAGLFIMQPDTVLAGGYEDVTAD